MKPKFALDLSHEGINLLHRSKGGWSLVGSVDLDDPDMSAHLADLRRQAAALESGGLTCKIIIPNSQVLYTTLAAPGPDDIAREEQIRAGLDGLTPYPVSELVFDWRAAADRARVAVLARETMDEAETFAVEHRFNPVSFVARPPQGEFSGEPFFGKTRAAAKILGPNERVEPDASPVPRKPTAMEPSPASVADAAPAPGQPLQPEPQAAPYSPGDLAWQPPATPEPAQTPGTASTVEPVSSPVDAQRTDPGPTDDPFAELDAIQAELSGDPDALPAFRSRARRPQARPARPEPGADQPEPPPLAPFPPAPDEAGTLPPPQASRKAAASGTPRASAKPKASDGLEPAPLAQPATGPKAKSDSASGKGSRKRATPGSETATAPRPRKKPDGAASGAKPDRDDIPAQPGVAFSTRRGDSGATTTATPAARGAGSKPPGGASAQSPAQPATPAPIPPAEDGRRTEATPGDRRRAEMAAALARPLPGAPAGPHGPTTESQKPSERGSLSGAVRGAAGGLRAIGQRRGSGRQEAKPADTSMTELMRDAGSSEARISPDQYSDAPDALPADPAMTGPTQGSAPDAPVSTQDSGEKPGATATPPGTPYATKGSEPSAVPKAPGKAAPPPPEAAQSPTPANKPAMAPVPAAAPETPRNLSRGSVTTPAQPKDPASEAEALTVFGARRTAEDRNTRKYLGIVLTLLLLLAMASIAIWSSFFVEDAQPGLVTPDNGTVAPQAPDVVPGTAPAGDATPPDATAAPEETPLQDATPETETATAPDAAVAPRVLSPEEAEALYAETQIWQRAPEPLGQPSAPGLDMGLVPGPGLARAATADPAAIADPDLPVAPGGPVQRAAPLPPPPADTVFEMDDNGLVIPSPEGTVSPTGIIVFEGPPAVVPPVRPGPPALPEAVPEDATLDGAALEQAVEQAVEAAAALTTDIPPADNLPVVPDIRPAPRPEDVPPPETAAPDDGAQLDTGPDTPADVAPATAGGAARIETVAANPTSIEAAVEAVTNSFVDASDLAVARSPKPSGRPADIDQIVKAAMARAAAAPPAPAAPVTTTPAIPTSANVANQATTPNALNLREINLLGISGPSNARRALVRMENGRYITVKVGDRLDGGRVTSITSDGLTYQKGSRNYTLQLLPLG